MDTSVFKNTRFLFILFTAFLSILGIGIIIPVIPYIVEQYVDASQKNMIALYVGLLISLYSFCQFFAAPVLGALSDKYGRRPILLLCLLGSAAGYILFGIGGSLGILFLARVIDGITGGDVGTVFAYIADITKPQDRGKYFGIVGATVGLGFMLGPSVGGLVSHISLSAPLYLAAFLTLLNAAFGYFVLPESLSKGQRNSDFSLHHLNPFTQLSYVLKNNILKLLLFTGVFYFFPFAQLQGIGSVYLKDALNWSPANIGFFFLFVGIGDMITQGFLVGKLAPKFGQIKLVLAGFFLTGVAFLLYSFLPIFPLISIVVVYLIIYTLGSGLFEPSMNGLVSQIADPREQGRVQGASQSMQSITRIVAPLFAAFLYQFGHGLPYLVGAMLSAIGIYILWINKNTIQKHLHNDGH
jgi:DHA1 family tetracycline resistance protein-like MFS transporter